MLSYTLEVSLGGGQLYSPSDRLTLLNVTNFKETIVGSDRAWMVEFYSSWCGHCIHFAPTFKKFAADVYGWRDVVSVGAIDCAQDYNSNICRDYEVMGYPTLKFFPPEATASYTGQALNAHTVDALKKGMIDYVTDLQASSIGSIKAIQKWPLLKPIRSGGIQQLWKDSPEFYAIILVEQEGATIASEVMLDITPTIRKLKIPLQLRRAVKNKTMTKESDSLGFLHKIQLDQQIIAVDKENHYHTEISASAYSRDAWYTAIKDYIWSKSKELSLSGSKHEIFNQNSQGSEVATEKKEDKPISSKKDLITRRYKVFLSDLEKAMIYSLNHEVGQHIAIAGESLVSLQKYITVLVNYFPARPEIERFLKDLHAWIHQHEDVVKGEALSNWMSSQFKSQGIKINPKWIGCQGSKGEYGGYPCGLWTMWHTLTISQAKMGTGDPKEVLHAMQGFIQEFFGCRECARHFDQTIQQGKAFDENVNSVKDAALYLWHVHNKVNVRLAGDISEDPVYPKQVFPARKFCARCYTDMTGSDLWEEYDRVEVMAFLENMYSKNKISKQGLFGSQSTALQEHALARVDETLEELDMNNYSRVPQKRSFWMLFNLADISMCFVLWLSSALLIILFYLKFGLKKRFSNSALFGLFMRRRRPTSNTLIGKV